MPSRIRALAAAGVAAARARGLSRPVTLVPRARWSTEQARQNS